MIQGLIDACKALITAAGTLQKLGDERRAKLASYFEAISKVLFTIIERKNKGEKSVDVCAELSVYAEKLQEVGQSTLSMAELDRLSQELETAQHSRAMLFFTEFPVQHSYNEYLDQLNEAAGMFRGLANTLRAK